MIYAGYVNDEVVARLPLLLKSARINPDRKLQFDYQSFDKNDYIDHGVDRVRISSFELLDRVVSTDIFVVVPINQYFGRHAYMHAIKMIKSNYTMIFIDESYEQYLVMHQGNVFTKNYKNDIFFKLEQSVLPYVNPWKDALTEVLSGDWKLANKYMDMLKNNTRFKNDIDMLFSTIDATVIPKNEMIQKLIYVLQFTKYSDESMLKETFGDDAMYKAEIVTKTWHKLFGIYLNPESIAVVYEAELMDIEIIDRMHFHTEQEADETTV